MRKVLAGTKSNHGGDNETSRRHWRSAGWSESTGTGGRFQLGIAGRI